jgi:hypothetical protein
LSSGFNLTGRRGGACDRGIDYCTARVDSSSAAGRLVSAAATLGRFAILMFAVMHAVTASAQSGGVLAPGNAVVTGFSGAPLPSQIVAGQNPADAIFIDPAGPSVQVFNLLTPGAPPQAQVIPAPVSLVVTAAQVGQVFGVAIDNATPPNIYAAATSAYGLPIVAPGPGGAPARLHQGAPGATFMADLFGPGGGPGSIWRIDGTSGAVSLFANVTLNGAANAGPALGGLAFDSASKSLLVADRQTGMVHRFNLSGKEIGRYDHGVQGLAAAGQPQVPYTPSQIDITSPQFSSDNPATWDYASPQRLIFGLGVHAGRLYYAVASGLQIWSVSLAANGSFGKDARLELQVPPAQGPTEISKIVFDGNGDMILAERGAPTGDYQLLAVAQAGVGRVLRYAPVSAAPGTSGALWQPVADQYAIGFPGQYTNANGGVAVGYSYDANGNIDPASCGGFIWSTGEQLRNAADQTLAAALAANGSLAVNGLQGNGTGVVEPANAPPLLSYFVDYDALLDDPAARGHIGDIAIPTNCAPAPLQQGQLLAPGLPLPLPPSGLPPIVYVPLCPFGQPQTPNGQCHGYGGCPPGEVWEPRGRSCHPLPSCTNGMSRNGNGTCVCPAGEIINGGTIRCVAACPQGQAINPATGRCAGIPCPAGWEPQPNGTCTRNQTTCPPGETLGAGGTCERVPPPIQRCPPGEIMNATTHACEPLPCPPGQVRGADNACVPQPGTCPAGQQLVGNQCQCEQGNRNAIGVCINPDLITNPPQMFLCGPGQVKNAAGDCVPIRCPAGQTLNPLFEICMQSCPAGQIRLPQSGVDNAPLVCTPLAPYCLQLGQGVSAGDECETCPQGQTVSAAGTCVPICEPGNSGCTPPTCPPNWKLVQGVCIPPPTPYSGSCASGQIRTALGCAPSPTRLPPPTPTQPPPASCPPGQTRNAAGVCVAPLPPCPRGLVRNAAGDCVKPGSSSPPPCPKGETRNASGACVISAPVRAEPCPSGEVRSAAGACEKKLPVILLQKPKHD